MNEHLWHHLKYTPGIIQRQQDIICEIVDPADWKATLKIAHHVKVGKWVRVVKGTYKGDVGCVSKLETSGKVAVLLVPRLLSPSKLTGQSPSNKRKRYNPPPEPELFFPNVAKDTHTRNPLPSDVGGDAIPSETHFLHDGEQFEYSLIVKNYRMHSISTTVINIPTNSLSRFRFSRHPLILASSLPKPVEWIFEEGEKVYIPSSGKQGAICTVKVDGVEVKLNNGEDMVKVTWLDIRKVCVIGDYVEVLSGKHKGQKGWIQPRALDFVSPDLVCIIGDNPTDIKVNKCPFL